MMPLNYIESVVKVLLTDYSSEVEFSSRKNIVELIWRNELITRTELSNLTGLTLAAVSKIISKLLDDEIVIESKYVKGKGGRRSIGLSINKEKIHVIGVRISRNFYRICITNFSGEVIEEDETKFVKKDRKSITDEIIKKTNQYIKSDSKIVAVGISVPGPYNSREGRIELISSLPDFYNINIKEIFEENITVPTFIIQDAQAASFYCNFKTNISDLAFYFLDEGVGAGIVSNDNIVNGINGTASEVGHISINYSGERCSCGNKGCLELYCSSISFLEKVETEISNHENSTLINQSITLENIYDAARKGDEFAVNMVDELATYISIGVVNIVHAYNPKLIILDGAIMIGNDVLREKVLEQAKERLIENIFNDVMFDFLNDSDDLVIKGAAILAIKETIMKSSIF